MYSVTGQILITFLNGLYLYKNIILVTHMMRRTQGITFLFQKSIPSINESVIINQVSIYSRDRLIQEYIQYTRYQKVSKPNLLIFNF